MGKSTYPATNNQEAVDLNILNANAFHMVLNGDATTDVPTYEGNGTIPSVAKALHTMAAYKVPIPWEEGVSEADILQPRVFADNIFVPIRVPAVMDSIPSDLYWKLYFPTVGESLNDTGENYFREVLEETKSTFVVPFDIKTYLVNGVERPQVTVFVHKGNDVVEKIDVAELTYVDKNTFTLLNPATAGNIVEIYSTTIAAFTIVGAIRDDVYLAKDAVHADRLVAEQASTDAQDARDVAIAQRDVVIAEGDTQVARVVSEGTQQVALATEQAVRAEAAASVAEEASSKAYAPQSIIKATLGARPDGWTVADCDAPVASLSYSGNVVTVEAGLQVAYADNGRVQLSEELTSPQVVDLSPAADGTHYVYADIAEDGTFSGFGATAVAPEVGAEKADTLADHFNPAEVVMYNVAGSPVRRVYIGTAVKSSGVVTSVHCYSLGTVVTMPINRGNPVATKSLVLDELPYAYSRMMQVEPQLYGEGIWGKAGWIYTSAGLGVSATVRKEAIRVVTGTGLTAQYASIGGDFNANIPSPAKIRVTVHRGY
jgi:hypothetical protein